MAVASRKCFLVSKYRGFDEELLEFQYFNGFAISQKQKSIASFHAAICKEYPEFKVLEISSKSPIELGVSLSAFNLKINVDGKMIPLENVFQSSKCFEFGGPYLDLLDKTPLEAKRDERLKSSGKLIAFQFENQQYPLFPKTLFYDWFYCQALVQNKEILLKLIEYDAFTDIEFNHEKSINCQARSAAIAVSLYRQGKLEQALSNIELFIENVYNY